MRNLSELSEFFCNLKKLPKTVLNGCVRVFAWFCMVLLSVAAKGSWKVAQITTVIGALGSVWLSYIRWWAIRALRGLVRWHD